MTTTTASRIELKIPSRPEFIVVARLTVAAVATRMGFDYDDIEDLKVATGEAVTNAIQHGQSAESDENIAIICHVEPHALVIEVRDTGGGFNPELRRQVVEEGELQEGGLGLLLIESLMDDVQFKIRPGRGTMVRMTKRLAGV